MCRVCSTAGVRAAPGGRHEVPPDTPNPTPFTLHPAPYTLHAEPYTLRPTFFTPHPTRCSPQPTPHTLHPTPYTPYPTRCTLHPSPHTLQPTGRGLGFRVCCLGSGRSLVWAGNSVGNSNVVGNSDVVGNFDVYLQGCPRFLPQRRRDQHLQEEIIHLRCRGFLRSRGPSRTGEQGALSAPAPCSRPRVGARVGVRARGGVTSRFIRVRFLPQRRRDQQLQEEVIHLRCMSLALRCPLSPQVSA